MKKLIATLLLLGIMLLSTAPAAFCGDWTGPLYVRYIENQLDGNVFVQVANPDGSTSFYFSQVSPTAGTNHTNLLLNALTYNKPVRFYVTEPGTYNYFTYLQIGASASSF